MLTEIHHNVFFHICSLLDLKDIQNLSLTCTKLNAKISNKCLQYIFPYLKTFDLENSKIQFLKRVLTFTDEYREFPVKNFLKLNLNYPNCKIIKELNLFNFDNKINYFIRLLFCHHKKITTYKTIILMKENEHQKEILKMKNEDQKFKENEFQKFNENEPLFNENEPFLDNENEFFLGKNDWHCRTKPMQITRDEFQKFNEYEFVLDNDKELLIKNIEKGNSIIDNIDNIDKLSGKSYWNQFPGAVIDNKLRIIKDHLLDTVETHNNIIFNNFIRIRKLDPNILFEMHKIMWSKFFKKTVSIAIDPGHCFNPINFKALCSYLIENKEQKIWSFNYTFMNNEQLKLWNELFEKNCNFDEVKLKFDSSEYFEENEVKKLFQIIKNRKFEIDVSNWESLCLIPHENVDLHSTPNLSKITQKSAVVKFWKS